MMINRIKNTVVILSNYRKTRRNHERGRKRKRKKGKKTKTERERREEEEKWRMRRSHLSFPITRI